jgi:hypothetical protein
METGGSRNWKGENCVILQIDESWHRRERLSILRRQTQDISRPPLRMHFEHFRCEMPGFCNATQCLHQVSKLTAGRYHLATAFTYQGTTEVRRTMSPIGTFRT